MEADWKQTGNVLEVDWKQIRKQQKHTGRRQEAEWKTTENCPESEWKQARSRLKLEYCLPIKMYSTTLFLQQNTNSKPYKG